MVADVLEAFVGEMTVSELCSRTGRSIDERLAFCTEATQRPANHSAAPKPAKKNSRKLGKGSGHAALEGRVMKLLRRKGKGRGGRELADALGVPVPKIRDTLKRLAPAERVRFAGETRARRYWAT